ncbi:MAG: hypothetical protein FWC96_08775 [Oscillospiraceae bacterium]|nr:hypothetical protein [Oscillospiraceae bacterium]
MKKGKFLIVLLTLAFLMVLAACGEQTTDAPDEYASTEETPADAPAVDTPAYTPDETPATKPEPTPEQPQVNLSLVGAWVSAMDNDVVLTFNSDGTAVGFESGEIFEFTWMTPADDRLVWDIYYDGEEFTVDLTFTVSGDFLTMSSWDFPDEPIMFIRKTRAARPMANHPLVAVWQARQGIGNYDMIFYSDGTGIMNDREEQLTLLFTWQTPTDGHVVIDGYIDGENIIESLTFAVSDNDLVLENLDFPNESPPYRRQQVFINQLGHRWELAHSSLEEPAITIEFRFDNNVASRGAGTMWMGGTNVEFTWNLEGHNNLVILPDGSAPYIMSIVGLSDTTLALEGLGSTFLYTRQG